MVFSGQILVKKHQKLFLYMTSGRLWEPLKQALLASRDVIISSQICVLKLQRFFTLGDGCGLPRHGLLLRDIGRRQPKAISVRNANIFFCINLRKGKYHLRSATHKYLSASFVAPAKRAHKGHCWPKRHSEVFQWSPFHALWGEILVWARRGGAS